MWSPFFFLVKIHGLRMISLFDSVHLFVCRKNSIVSIITVIPAYYDLFSMYIVNTNIPYIRVQTNETLLTGAISESSGFSFSFRNRKTANSMNQLYMHCVTVIYCIVKYVISLSEIQIHFPSEVFPHFPYPSL